MMPFTESTTWIVPLWIMTPLWKFNGPPTHPWEYPGRLHHSNWHCNGRSSWWSAPHQPPQVLLIFRKAVSKTSWKKSPFSRPWAAWRDSLKGNWCSRRTHHRCTRYRVAPWWMPGELGEKILIFRIFVGQQQKNKSQEEKDKSVVPTKACDLTFTDSEHWSYIIHQRHQYANRHIQSSFFEMP